MLGLGQDFPSAYRCCCVSTGHLASVEIVVVVLCAAVLCLVSPHLGPVFQARQFYTEFILGGPPREAKTVGWQ